MKTSDSRAVVLLVQTLAQIDRGEVSVQGGVPSKLRSDACKRFIESVKEAAPEVVAVPGTGACICGHSPEAATRHALKMGSTLAAYNMNMQLDHRCPHHGERAQPTLWGRHKEKTLVVTPAEWNSLGVTYTEPQP